LEGVIVDNYNSGPDQTFTVASGFVQEMSSFQTTLKNSNQYVLLGLRSGISANTTDYTYYNDLLAATCVVVSG